MGAMCASVDTPAVDMFRPLIVRTAMVTNTATSAISNIRSPSIRYANVEGERENQWYLRTDGAKDRTIELSYKVLRHIRRFG